LFAAEEDIWPEMEAARGGWRKLHSKKLHDLYILPNLIRHIKSRRMIMSWAYCICGTEERFIRGFDEEA
jgi:hypothetical protein